jgi:hypothetical protein
LKDISSENGVICKNASFNICGVVAGYPDRCLQLAFVDLWFDNDLLLKEVHFLVYECGYDIILEIMSVRDINGPCSGKRRPLHKYRNMTISTFETIPLS